MKRLSLAAASLLFVAATLTPAEALGQQTVRGRVTNANTGEPLAGVQIVVTGTQIGTLSNDAGRFTLRGVPEDAETVRFRRIGYQTVEREITGAAMSVQMTPTAVQLEGVTVTAMGIERQQRSLGYDVQTISGDETVEVPESNFLNSLQGKISGANITSSSYPGGSTRITLRGESSITGDNQPLIVIDGVPLIDENGGAGTYSGIDYGNAANLIDPNNVESISVLKGASAAALYGSRASNGAIIIETKSARGGRSGWQVRQTVEFARPLRLPDYQNQYGQGSNTCAYAADFGSGCEGQFRFVDGAGGGTYDFFDESWGPPMNGQPIDQWHGEGMPFDPAPNNVRNFFETGITSRTNVSFNASGETVHGRVGLTYENMQGMAPGSEMQDFSSNLKGGLQITEDFTANASVQYVRDIGSRRPHTGYDGANFMQQFVWFGRQVEVGMLERWSCEDWEEQIPACSTGPPTRFQANWNYNYHDNPYMLQLANNNHDETDRVIGNVELTYDVNDWLAGTFKTGIDWFREHRKREYRQNTAQDPTGGFGENNLYRRETNVRGMLQARGLSLNEDFSLNANAGANIRDNHRENESVSVAELNVPGIYTVNNAAVQPQVGQFTGKKRVYSVFADATLGFRDYAHLSATARNDWSSTLPEDERSYFYPSVSANVIFTDALGMETDFLTYGKIRGGWSRVGNDTNPYQLQTTYGIARRWAGQPGYTVPNQLPNLNLQPEETTSWEAGIDLEFFDGRIRTSYTWYQQTTTDQIMPIQVSATTGYSGQVTNAGKMRNRGHEVQIQARPVDAAGFSWDVRGNWSLNNNRVVDLAGDLQTLVLDNYWNGSLEAREGEPYGVLRGLKFPTTDDGTPILTQTPFGPLPARDGEKKILDETRPDWTANLTNTFNYDRFELSFTFDGQLGGAIFSTTKWFGLYAGVLQETLRGRENGVCDPGIQLEGVNESGDEVSGTVCPEAYFENSFNSTNVGLVDQTYMKLRNARLAFRVPQDWANSVGFDQMSVAVIGRNLWLLSKADHIDPDFTVRSNNIQGWEHGQFPTARSVGLTVTLRP